MLPFGIRCPSRTTTTPNPRVIGSGGNGGSLIRATPSKGEDMAQYKVLQRTPINGERRNVGDIVELPEGKSHYLVANGRLEAYTPPKAQSKKPKNAD